MDEEARNRWQPAAPGVALGEQEVVIWRIDLRGSPKEVAAAEGLVTEPENARAARFLRARDRESFLLQRAALRVQLAAYLGTADPRNVAIVHHARGKPKVVQSGSTLEFNVSGSGEIGLIAFSRGAPVGVDVEMQREVDELELAGKFFAADESAELRALPAELRREGFFNAWTRKEAFIKALGEGLHFPLDRFAVSLRPDEPARLHRIDGGAERVQDWTLATVPIDAGYAAAVVRRGGAFAIRRFQAPAMHA